VAAQDDPEESAIDVAPNVVAIGELGVKVITDPK
jgi:hypothetical protein